MTKNASQSPPQGPKGLLSKCWKAQEASRGSARPGPSTRLPRLQREGLSPPGGSPGGAATPSSGAAGAAGVREIGAGSFLSETETARCFPPALPPGATQRQPAPPSCSPALRPTTRTAGPRLPARGPSEPQCSPSLSHPGAGFQGLCAKHRVQTTFMVSSLGHLGAQSDLTEH